jgi:guanine nucleotide-binding protein G(i) subunit alpha
MDSGKYFFKNMSRFVAPDFIPNDEDIVRARTRTTGIVESTFQIEDHKFLLVDVGGQRSERRRWMHSFDDVTAVIFFASLTEYDQVLYEDSSKNRMAESLDLFGEMSSSSWFNRSAFLLFLNKVDLFEEKIARTEMTALFPEYDGGHDFEGGLDFLKEQYEERCTRKGAKIYTHFTTATDKSNVEVIFNKCKEVIISQNLERLGFGRL